MHDISNVNPNRKLEENDSQPSDEIPPTSQATESSELMYMPESPIPYN